MSVSRRYRSRGCRGSVVSRVLAAILGGYCVVSLLSAAVALALPEPRYEAAMVASMIAYLAYPAIIMAVFHTSSAARAWVWLVGAVVPLALILWLFLPGAMP
ncbi:hypothetical protein MB02_03860 [Croceicoccus estronivorus]|nr:hypothetical protein MB02_03860 [Croceicoccus estronivorus]